MSAARGGDGAFARVASSVRDGVEGVGDRDDARLQRNVAAAQAARISAPVPSLVVREHAVGELGIEGVERSEDVGAELRVRDDQRALLLGELLVVVDDVEERLVDLPDVVKECDALDGALVRAHSRSAASREDERVGGDAADVCAGFGVVRVDGVEECLEGGGGDSLGRCS